MANHTPFIIDATKRTIAAYGGTVHVVTTVDGRIAALCPITDAPIYDGQFSAAAMIQIAVNCHADLVAALRLVLDSALAGEGVGDAELEAMETALAKAEGRADG